MASISPTAGYDNVPLLEDSDRIQGRKSGDPVAVGQAENANKQALALSNNIEALKAGTVKAPRNCVIFGPTSISGSDPAFATFASDILTIDGSVTPMICNFANGISNFGTKDEVVKFTGTLTIDYTAVTGQHLVFLVWDGTNFSLVSLSLGNTNPRYHASLSAPAFDTTDQFWFSPADNAMYRDVGGAGVWVQVMAILLGGADVGATDNWYGKPYGMPAFDIQNPAGEIRIWHNTASLPRGFILCDGSTVKVSRFPDLYNAMGTVYASTTPLDEFDLPDFSGETLGTGPASVLYMMKAY